jgi:hypothetical protein
VTRADFAREFSSVVAAVTFEEAALTDGRLLPAVAARVLSDEDYPPPPEYYTWLLGQVALAQAIEREAAYEAAQQAEESVDRLR